MKVIEIPFCFYPDPVGGTEIYVESLSRHLQHHGIEVVVSAPARDRLQGRYFRDGLKVRRFPQSEKAVDLVELYGEGDREAASAFGQILHEERPDVVHLHAFTSACSLRLVRETRRRGIPVLFTYHTPTVSCQRGTLLRWGTDVCDGKLDLGLCTSCTLHGLGLSRALADVVSCVPVVVGNLLGSVRLSGGAWTALRMRELVQARHTAFRKLMTEVDHVIAVCEWVRDLLMLNGVVPAKVTLCRQGLVQERNSGLGQHAQTVARDSKHQGSISPPPIRIVFLGRLDSTKGVHILIQALRMEPDLPITLDVYGVEQGTAGASYFQRLRALAADDSRITFRPPVPAKEVVEYLRGYDLVAIPSQLRETGPLVLLEALAAGIPVLGSKLGGISELVEHEVNGLLVEPDSIEAWRQALRRFSEDRELLMRLRSGVLPPRGMPEVAEEMAALYHSILKKKAARREAALG